MKSQVPEEQNQWKKWRIMVEEDESEVLGKFTRVKPTTPVAFDRDWEKGCAFLNTCSIYFTICGPLFPNDQACIHWALLLQI
jgi:hypothetical protein